MGEWFKNPVTGGLIILAAIGLIPLYYFVTGRRLRRVPADGLETQPPPMQREERPAPASPLAGLRIVSGRELQALPAASLRLLPRIAQAAPAPANSIMVGMHSTYRTPLYVPYSHGVIAAETRYGKNFVFMNAVMQLLEQGAIVAYATGKYESHARDGAGQPVLSWQPVYERCQLLAIEPTGVEAFYLLMHAAALVEQRIQAEIDAAAAGLPPPIFDPFFLCIDELKVFMTAVWPRLGAHIVKAAASAIKDIVARGAGKGVYYWTTAQDMTVKSLIIPQATMGNFDSVLLAPDLDDQSFKNGRIPAERRPQLTGAVREWYVRSGPKVQPMIAIELNDAIIQGRMSRVPQTPAAAQRAYLPAQSQHPAPAGATAAPGGMPAAAGATGAASPTVWTDEDVKAASFIYQVSVSGKKLSLRALARHLWEDAKPTGGGGRWQAKAGEIHQRVIPLVDMMRGSHVDTQVEVEADEGQQNAENVIAA